jgi:hypothetical protein
VVPIDWTKFASTPPGDADSQRAQTILLNSNRYSLTHWYQVRGYHNQLGYYLDFGSTGEHRIRSAGSVAMALAIALQLGIYDSGVVTDLGTHTPEHLMAVENQLNHRPRRVLGDRTPADLFTALLTSERPSVLRR